EVLAGRASGRGLRQPQLGALELVVDPPVVELVGEAGANAEAVVGGGRDVAAVEQPVDVGAEKEPVREVVWAASSVGDDVGGLQRRERVLACDGAFPVGPLHGEAEGALTEAGADDLLDPVARSGVRGTEERGLPGLAGVADDGEAGTEGSGALKARLPDAMALPSRGVVPLPCDGVVGPIGGAGDPEVVREEDGAGEEVAADGV